MLLASCGTKEPPRQPPELQAGQTVSEALGPGEVHRYRIPLRQGDFLRLTVNQQGVDLVATLEDPSGAKILEADRFINDQGLELVMAVAATRGTYTLLLTGLQEGKPGRYEARIETLRPALAADRRSAEAYRIFTGSKGLDAKEAMERQAQARAVWHELGETALEAEALDSLARGAIFQRDNQQGAKLYREAVAGFARAGNPRWEAIARNGLGTALMALDETEEAARQYTLAFRLARRANDRLNQARALHGLGQARQYQGDLQQALDCYRKALGLWPEEDPLRLRATTLHQLGVLYARYLHDGHRGRDRLLQARAAWSPDDKRNQATTASQLGRIAYEEGRFDDARREFKEALELRREADRCGSAVFLARLALVEEAQGKRPDADARIAEALRMVTSQPCPRSEPTVRSLGADLAEKRGDPARARDGYQRCERLYAGLGDRMGRAESLAGIAHAARALGDLKGAREASRQALDIVEGVRPTVLDESLRTSYFSGVQDWFDNHIDLLLEMGSAEEAWATAERARARALSDLLAESGAGLRRTASKNLIERESALQKNLNVLETRRLAASESKPEKMKNFQETLAARMAELENLRGEIRRGNPALPHSGPVSPTKLRELLDADTLLLEYRLGRKKSTVWAVTRDSVTAFPLPPRNEIEPQAREAASWLQDPEGTGETLCELSRMLLSPVAGSLGHYRRLALVTDGALEILPFAALPVPGASGPCDRAPLLVDAHETVSLPSAAALLTQRRLLAARRPAPGWLAVVADPQYDKNQDGTAFSALPGSGQEASAITAELPPGRVFTATGNAASRQTVTGGALRQFRVLHFATHGTLNADQPMLSSLALSGDALLPAHEIYDLDLPAELVVLAACDTQLGRDVPGEGLVSGLPRAFLYAGAARVLVSLWAVKDQSTRELMVRFYHGLFREGLPPALALQKAQSALRQAGRSPNEWAGFVLLGDWRPLPPFDR